MEESAWKFNEIRRCGGGALVAPIHHMTPSELRSEVESGVEAKLDSNGLDEFAAEEEFDSAAEGQRDFFAAVGQPDLAAEAKPDLSAQA